MFLFNEIKWGGTELGTASGTVTWADNLTGLTSSNGSNESLDNALAAAFERWSEVADVTFVETSGAADISVGFSSFSTDSNLDNDGALATASWFQSNIDFSEPISPRLEFNTDELWSPGADSNASTYDFYAVALHEIGHIIGFDHVNDASQIMFPFISPSETAPVDLGSGDIDGAQTLYGDGPGSTLALAEDDDVLADTDPPGFADGGDDGGGGGGGGLIALLLGLLGLAFAGLTGGAGVAVVAAARSRSDDDASGDAQDPGGAEFEFVFHALFAEGHGGCDHGHDDHSHIPHDLAFECDDPVCGCHSHHAHASDDISDLLALPQIPAEEFAQPIYDDEEAEPFELV